MPTRPAVPRIPPLAPADRSEEQQELLGAIGGAQALNVFATLARHPGLFRRWGPFAGKLLQGSKLPAREREIVILRVAWRCGSSYEWGQHAVIARDAGVSADEIPRVAADSETGWTLHEAALIRSVDELIDEHCISDATWTTLSKTYDGVQLIELTMLAGHYALLAGTLNSLGVQTEGPLPALGEAAQ